MRVTVLSGYGAYSGFAASSFTAKIKAATAKISMPALPTSSSKTGKSAGIPKHGSMILPSSTTTSGIRGGAGNANNSAATGFTARLRQAAAAIQTIAANSGVPTTGGPAPTNTPLPTTLLDTQPPVPGQEIPEYLLHTPPSYIPPTPTTTTGQPIPVVSPYEVTPPQPVVAGDDAALQPAGGGLPSWALPSAAAGLLIVGALVVASRSKRRGASPAMQGYRSRARQR